MQLDKTTKFPADLLCVFNGELSREIFHWQAYCRKMSRNFANTYFMSIDRNSFLYEDFAKEGFAETSITIAYQKYNEIPFQEQEFIKFGKPKGKIPFLIYAKSGENYINLSNEEWERIAKNLKGDTASVGKDSYHIKGTIDLRSNDLKTLTNYMAGANCIIGPDSDIMHLAALCDCRRIVWCNLSSEKIIKERYEKIWNPFSIQTIFLERHNKLKPEFSQIINAAEEIDSCEKASKSEK